MGTLPDKEGKDVGGCRNRFSHCLSPDTTFDNAAMAKKKNKTVSLCSFPWLGSLVTVVRLLDHGVGTVNASLRTRKARHDLTHPAHFAGELTVSP